MYMRLGREAGEWRKEWALGIRNLLNQIDDNAISQAAS